MNYESVDPGFKSRADFWVGVGPGAEWLGSVCHYGGQWQYPSMGLLPLTGEQDYRQRVTTILQNDPLASMPSDGWPWPWPTSADTDYVYTWLDGWVVLSKRDDWPDMSGSRPAVLGPRSGVFFVD